MTDLIKICKRCNDSGYIIVDGRYEARCPECSMAELEILQDKLQQIKNWINAYPLEMFPEPDLEKMAKVLKENGMTLDSISASNMRHVLSGIKEIIEK